MVGTSSSSPGSLGGPAGPTSLRDARDHGPGRIVAPPPLTSTRVLGLATTKVCRVAGCWPHQIFRPLPGDPTSTPNPADAQILPRQDIVGFIDKHKASQFR